MDQLDLEYHYEGGFSLNKEELQIYSEQVKNGAYQIIICFGLSTLDFVEKNFAPLPPQTTMIVCNVPSPLAERLPTRKNVIGVIQKLDVARDFYLINKLFPAKRKVILLTAWDENGRCFQEEARKAIKAYPSLELNVIDNKTVSTKEMLQQVASADSDTVVLFQGWYNKSAVNAASLQHLLNSLGNKLNVPLFVTHCTMVRAGTVGGDVECGAAQGAAVADKVRRLLDGEKADVIPRQTLPDKIILNDAMLKFYQIPEEYIPAGVEIIGRGPGIWAFYEKEIIIGGVVFVLLLSGAAVLLIWSMRYRMVLSLATRVVRESPIHILIIDEQEKIYSCFLRNKIISPEENLKDVHLENYDQMHKIIQDTLLHGGHHRVDFVLNGVHRRGFLVRLSRKISGRAAVLMVDLDVEQQYLLMQEQQLLLTCLNAIMPDHEQKQSVETILKIFCEFFNGERSYLTHFDMQESCMEIIGEYHSPTSRPIKQDFHKAPISTTEPWFIKLKNQHEPTYYDVENNVNLDCVSAFWQEVMRRSGVVKLYSMPINFQGELWGCWSLIYKDKDIQPPHASLMRMIPNISNMIEMVLFRQIYLSKLEESQAKALVAVRAKSAFLATMSHELRTPLNAIIGFTELMSDGTLSYEKQQEYIEGISHSSKALLALINNILDFSKLETGSMKRWM